jgi:hypothetical protein
LGRGKTFSLQRLQCTYSFSKSRKGVFNVKGA